MDKLNKLSEERSKNNQDKISVCMKVNETKQIIIAINLLNVFMYILQSTYHEGKSLKSILIKSPSTH